MNKTPVLEHLLELRRRFLWCLLFYTVAFAVSYYQVEHIYAYLMQPLVDAYDDPNQRRMIYTGLHEAFFTYLRLSFFAGLFFSVPLLLIQVWRFIAPGLYDHERRSMLPALMVTPVLFLLGAGLCFYGIIPLAWDFFLGFEKAAQPGEIAVQLEARVSEYLSLVTQLILAFGICFELPVLLFLLARIGMVTADTLAEYRKHVVVLAFLVAAFLTPPDLISQIALGLPVLLLYEISIWVIRLSSADTQARARKAMIG